MNLKKAWNVCEFSPIYIDAPKWNPALSEVTLLVNESRYVSFNFSIIPAVLYTFLMFVREPYWPNSIMKTDQHNFREKVVQRFKEGLSYKTKSWTLKKTQVQNF